MALSTGRRTRQRMSRRSRPGAVRNRTQPKPESRPRFKTVSIPDLRSQNISAFEEPEQPDVGLPVPDQIDVPATGDRQQRLAKPTHPDPLDSIRDAIASSAATQRSTHAVADTETERLLAFDSSEDVQRVGSANPPRSAALRTNNWLSLLTRADKALMPLIEAMLAEYPPGGTGIFMLTGVAAEQETATVAARSVLELQKRTNGRVLLIDGNCAGRHLSDSLGCDTRSGFTDLLKGHDSFAVSLHATSANNVEFMPNGTAGVVDHTRSRQVLRKLLPKLVGQYDYVIVAAGDAHDYATRAWCSYVHGTWLLVDQTQANRLIATSAARQLRDDGARLLGCIAVCSSDAA